MDPTKPASAPSTFPATEAVGASPTLTVEEEEVAASLLMLIETARPLEEFYLSLFVQSPLPAGSSRVEVHIRSPMKFRYSAISWCWSVESGGVLTWALPRPPVGETGPGEGHFFGD
jgi:hypothetical protein